MLIGLALAGLAWVVWLTADVFFLIFGGVLLAILLAVPSEWIQERTGLGYRWSLALVVTTLVLVTALGVWLLATRLSQQVAELQQTIPRAIDQLHESLRSSPIGNATLEKAKEQTDKTGFNSKVMDGAQIALTSTFGVLASFFFVLFLGLFLAIEPKLYQRGFLLLIPRRHCAQAEQLLCEVGCSLRWWLLGTLFSMTVVGILSGIGLWMLGIPNAVILAILTALLTFIPNIGPILSVVLPALLALMQGPINVLYVILLYLGIQTVETYALTPLVQRKVIHLPPAILISTQVFMGVLSGPLGLMLATPLTVCAMVLIKRLYIQDYLGKDIGCQPETPQVGQSLLT